MCSKSYTPKNINRQYIDEDEIKQEYIHTTVIIYLAQINRIRRPVSVIKLAEVRVNNGQMDIHM